MKLTFNNNQCEFIVNGDFNIHLECKSKFSVLVLLKTGEGTLFADVDVFYSKGSTFDCDFTGYVYPKSIKLIISSKVIEGYVTENA